MRHRKAGIKLNRTSSHRNAMFRNMVTSLLKHERITTTDAKAKALRGWADHVITLAKRGDLHARRQALAIVREKDLVHKLFEEAPQRFGAISGGYTRIAKIGHRPGDAAPMVVMELVGPGHETKKKTKKKSTKKETAPAVAAPEAAPIEAATEPEAPEAAPAETAAEVPETPAEASAETLESAPAAEEASSEARTDAATPAGPEDGEPKAEA